MNNFGVIEVAGIQTKATPGWAYVPDTGPSVPSLQPANRKRAARNLLGLTLSDLTARQENKLRKDLEALSRDNGRDVNIAIPPRKGRDKKQTPNVRRILQSQKTFVNYLDDYGATLADGGNGSGSASANASAVQTKASTPVAAASPAPTTMTTTTTTDVEISMNTSMTKRGVAAAKRAAAREKTAPVVEDVEMIDVPEEKQKEEEEKEEEEEEGYPADGSILPAYKKKPPQKHPGDEDPLLVSVVPPFPTDEELKSLMTALPLSYFDARATWREEEEGRYPVRVFCEVCGYWGRVKCIKCGVRVCALDCLESHKEECVTRYGL
ncbi:hypothetical protein QBC38DRAFT_468787 [Podospora fimiseda]|uniref:HIT-type domain-containing protein n=1 Tax=Podospora fimiseda TaxID=252190 RepID=A0AAN7H2T9_9PEZI|nr:hypothetical protein QBC38DRAFT_468787 [Podospora fimiseda]